MSSLSQRVFLASFIALVLAIPAAAQEWDAPAREMAEKIIARAQSRSGLSLTVKNISSLPPARAAEVQRALESALRSRGVSLVEARAGTGASSSSRFRRIRQAICGWLRSGTTIPGMSSCCKCHCWRRPSQHRPPSPCGERCCGLSRSPCWTPLLLEMAVSWCSAAIRSRCTVCKTEDGSLRAQRR